MGRRECGRRAGLDHLSRLNLAQRWQGGNSASLGGQLGEIMATSWECRDGVPMYDAQTAMIAGGLPGFA